MREDASFAVDRRAFVLGCGVTALVSRAVAGSSPRGLIDVHHHVRPPGAPEGFARLTAGWSPAGAIADMDRTGVATGIAYPGPILIPGVEARAARARQFNEFTADLARAHPGRFGLFASLPFPDVDTTLAEIDYAHSKLAADGFGIATSYGEMWLGDARLAPIWERLDALKAVVFVHPHDAACCAPKTLSYLQPDMDGSWIDWPMNTARTIFSLMTSGTLRRYPRIRFIFSHGGGVMPLLVKRLANFTRWSAVGPERMKTLFPNGVEAEFRTLHFECAQAWDQPNFAAIRALVPESQLLFGSDYPFFTLDDATRGFNDLALAPRRHTAMARANAARLLPRWA